MILLCRRAQRGLSGFTIASFFAIFTLGGFCPSFNGGMQSAFGGMYVTGPVMVTIKNILNVGVLIVLIQAAKWANSEHQVIRRGEFFGLLLLTLRNVSDDFGPSLPLVCHWS